MVRILRTFLAISCLTAAAQTDPFRLEPDDVFRALPDALESLDREMLTELLAPTEVRVDLGGRFGHGGALYSAEQVIYMLEDYLKELQLTAPAEPAEFSTYRSRSGAVVCECYPARERGGRITGVLHLSGQRERRSIQQKLYIGLRQDAGGFHLVELRLLP